MADFWRAPDGTLLDLRRPLLDATGTVWLRRVDNYGGPLMLWDLRADGALGGFGYQVGTVWRNYGPLVNQEDSEDAAHDLDT